MSYDCPTVGRTVQVTLHVNNHLPPSHRLATQRTVVGEVVASLDSDDPASFRMVSDETGVLRLNHPIRQVYLDCVISMQYVDGDQVNQLSNGSEPDVQTWQVDNGRGSIYTVVHRGDSWNCDCKGFQFRQSCKHVNQFKQELMDQRKEAA